VHPDRVKPLPPLREHMQSTSDQARAPVNNPAIIWHPASHWPVPAVTAATAWREYLEVGGSLPLWIVGRDADAVASVPALATVLDECCQLGGSWQTRTLLPGRRLDRLLNRAGVLWNPSVADDGHWLVARALARGIPVVAGDTPHLRSSLLGDTAQIPALRTYAAHDVIAAAAALLAASALATGNRPAFPGVSPVSSHPISWRETLDILQPHAHDG
jgi:hypothetical protein